MQTLEEMVIDAQKSFRKADALLNQSYQKLMRVLDAAGRNKLIRAQRAWVAFRDANAALFGDYLRGDIPADKIGLGQELHAWQTKEEMTMQRIRELDMLREERKAAG